jgi:tetratricopeptide (TPR) repeat protein
MEGEMAKEKQKKTCRFLKTCVFLWIGLLVLSSSHLFSQKDKERTIQVKIAVDEALKYRESYQLETRRLILKVFRCFKDQFGLTFKVRDFCWWKPEADVASMSDHLNTMRRKVPKEDCDLAIGVIHKEGIRRHGSGIASYLHGILLIEDRGSKEIMELILKHELCHLFGAVDIVEPGSVMNFEKPGLHFDEFTKALILLNKDRSFSPAGFPLSEEKIARAIELCQNRADLGLRETELHLTLASLYLQIEDLASAAAECQRAKKLNSDSWDIDMLLGNIHMKMGELDQALADYKRVLTVKPGFPETHFNLGLIYAQTNRPDDAFSCFLKAVELVPECGPAHLKLAKLYYDRKDYERALLYLDNAEKYGTRIDPQFKGLLLSAKR